jgi:outer membrane lipoprotein carrier protein
MDTRTRFRSAMRRAFLTASAAAAFCAVGLAPIPAAAAALDQLREFAVSTRSAKGQFTQQMIRSSGKAGETASGTFAFVRPGKFRWEVTKPDQQLIVTDGEMLHFYDADLKQVTVRRVGDAISATPAAILFGSDDLDQSFVLKELGERDGLVWLEALPRSREAGFERIRIGFRDRLPVAMEVRDAFSQMTRFEFTNVERNPQLDPGLFRFTAPEGVDVIQ